MRPILSVLVLALLWTGCRATSPAPRPAAPPPAPVVLSTDTQLKLEKGSGNELRWKTDRQPTLLISTSQGASLSRDPVREIPLGAPSGSWLDRQAPDGVTCFYRVRVGERVSNEVAIAWPDRPLPSLSQPSLLVDKPNFCLEVRDGETCVKRYPIAMGRKCQNRKVCYDNATTPEGRYQIICLQPEATFYRAYDIDYPNAHDQERYDFFRQNGLLDEGSDIGGEIQIHGRGIASNWTFGCMALRNEDMDELFSHPEIGVGTPVTIVGHELSRADLEAADRADPATVALALQKVLGPDAACDARSLGRFQLERKLPVSCLPDARTLKALRLR